MKILGKTEDMQPIGYIFSCALHLILAVTIILWPTKALIVPDNVLKISIATGKIGGNKLPSRVLGPRIPVKEPVTSQVQAQESSQVMEPAKEVKTPGAQEQVQQPKAIPIAKDSVVEKKDAPLEAKPIAENKVQGKEQKTTEKAVSKSPKDKAEVPKPVPQEKDQKKLSKGKTGASSISDALASLKKEARGIGGGGGEGKGPGGGGLQDVYAGLVMMAVRPNWSSPTYSRDNLIVYIRVRIDPKGKVLSCNIERSSGRADFDASAVNAVIRTKMLPVPPTAAQQDLVIVFNSLEAAKN